MNVGCRALVDDGVIRGVLAAVDCETRHYAQLGYSALTAGSGVFQSALTALLTIYVAVVGYRLLFARGDVRLSDAPVMALKIGAILALVTNWATFQTLVFDVAGRVPKELAAVISAPLQDRRASLAAAPVEGLQVVYDELGRTAEALGKKAGPSARTYSSAEASAAQSITTATSVLFVMSAGVISAATLAIGVLTAVGPIFIALFLIRAARGIFGQAAHHGIGIGQHVDVDQAGNGRIEHKLRAMTLRQLRQPWRINSFKQRVARRLAHDARHARAMRRQIGFNLIQTMSGYPLFRSVCASKTLQHHAGIDI